MDHAANCTERNVERTQGSFARRVFALFAALVLCIGAIPIANAATFVVTKTADTNDGVCDADCSLREAVIAANANTPIADTITVPAGLYTLDLVGAAENSAATGDLDILESVTITGAGARSTIIDGNGTDRIIEVENTATIQMSGMTLQNANAGAAVGGAILNDHDSSLTLIDMTIAGNTTTGDGGGVANSGGSDQLTVIRSTFSDNTGKIGGGIKSAGNTTRVWLTNVTLTGNTATSAAGAISCNHCNLTNVTIVGNTAPATKGGGIEFGGGQNKTALNTIVANNTGGDCTTNTFGSGSNSIDSDGSCGVTTTADPKLNALANNGGPTDTMYPQADSPAIEGGTNTGCPTTDQRGVTRPDGILCDVGAVEVVLNQLTGTVFEDVNYGGGMGRDLATAAADAPSFTVGRGGVTVEIYNAGGNFVASTATVAGGSYSFSVAPGTYTVRVVNSTVTSSRPGSTGSELAVQTYRIDGVAEAVGDGAKKVGGELPSNEDAAANSGAQTLASLQGTDLDADGIPEWTQSIVTVDASAGDVSGVDFGFNFDVVVNTNNAGQGSLRQFIINSNLLN